MDYIVSAFFADYILNEYQGRSIDAIYYPSVKNSLSFENIAIKTDVFDANYELVKVKEAIITNDLSNEMGGYSMSGISDCNEFDFETGAILWNPDRIYQPDHLMHQFQTLFGLDIS